MAQHLQDEELSSLLKELDEAIGELDAADKSYRAAVTKASEDTVRKRLLES